MSIPPPLFSAVHSSSGPNKPSSVPRSTAAQLNLDDIFGDVVFTPDGDTVFLSEQKDNDDDDGGLLNSGEGHNYSTMARKATADGHFVPVQQGGGLYTTNLYDNSKVALTMGSANDASQPTAAVPFKHAPQASHHLQYAAPKKKKGSGRSERKMSEQQKSERR
jgi:hypothetical protein